MGSILIFAFIQIFIILLALLNLVSKFKCKWSRYLEINKTRASTLTFIYSTFFEIIVSISTAMGMVKYWDLLTDSDYVSICSQFLFSVALFSYILLVIYFALT